MTHNTSALLSRRANIVSGYFIIGQTETPRGFRFYNEAAASIERMLVSAVIDVAEEDDATFAALTHIRAADHVFLPGRVEYRPAGFADKFIYRYMILSGEQVFNLTYKEALENYVNDRPTAYRVCFPSSSELRKNRNH